MESEAGKIFGRHRQRKMAGRELSRSVEADVTRRAAFMPLHRSIAMGALNRAKARAPLRCDSLNLGHALLVFRYEKLFSILTLRFPSARFSLCRDSLRLQIHAKD